MIQKGLDEANVLLLVGAVFVQVLSIRSTTVLPGMPCNRCGFCTLVRHTYNIGDRSLIQ